MNTTAMIGAAAGILALALVGIMAIRAMRDRATHRGYRQGREQGYEKGFEDGRLSTDNWWMRCDDQVSQVQQEIRGSSNNGDEDRWP